jgi:hypothetical protein
MPDGTDGTSLTAFGQQTDALKGLWLAAFGVKRRGRLAKGVFVRRSAHPLNLATYESNCDFKYVYKD